MNHLTEDSSHERSFLIRFLRQQQTLKNVVCFFCGHAYSVSFKCVMEKHDFSLRTQKEAI